MKKYCKECNNEINNRNKIAKYCSNICRSRYYFKKITKGKLEVECLMCHKKIFIFPSKKFIFKYCSKECYGKARIHRIELICKICGKKFYSVPSIITGINKFKNRGSYCSKECCHKGWSKNRLANFKTEDAVKLYNEGKSCSDIGKILNCSFSAVWRRLNPLGILRDRGWKRRGQKLSDKIKLNMSLAQIKRFENPKERLRQCGKNNPFYGKKHNPETINRMKQKLSIMLSGDRNPQWLGGLSFEPYGVRFNNELKEIVKKRDGYKCQECSISQSRLNFSLQIHHIDYNKQNNNTSNLIALCRKCHLKTNFNRKDWIKYFQSKTKEYVLWS